MSGIWKLFHLRELVKCLMLLDHIPTELSLCCENEVATLPRGSFSGGFCRKLSLSQHDCRGQGTDGITRSPCPQDSISVGNCPPAGSGKMDWAAPGNCWAQQWPDLRCEVLQGRARLALPPHCRKTLAESWGELTEASWGRE